MPQRVSPYSTFNVTELAQARRFKPSKQHITLMESLENFSFELPIPIMEHQQDTLRDIIDEIGIGIENSNIPTVVVNNNMSSSPLSNSAMNLDSAGMLSIQLADENTKVHFR